MYMVSIGNAIKPMQIYENMCGIHGGCLDKLQSAFDRYGLSVAKPSSSHGLSSIGSLYGRAGHAISTVLGGFIVMNSDGSTNDRMGPAQRQIWIGEKLDRAARIPAETRHF